jgi:EAL domain-containing protein (putative c-di-GMP-specific phosphodiesterase class I)
VRRTLERYDIAPSSLVLELTETVLCQDGPEMPRRIAELRDLGVKIAIDDFGTGYSSLGYLQTFNVDILKVDKTFIDGLGGGSSKTGTLARAIVSLAHLMHLEIVAEGIEHVEQRDELWSIGCGMGQGFLYAKPLDAEVLTVLLNGDRHLGRPSILVTQGALARLKVASPPRVHAAPWP